MPLEKVLTPTSEACVTIYHRKSTGYGSIKGVLIFSEIRDPGGSWERYAAVRLRREQGYTHTLFFKHADEAVVVSVWNNPNFDHWRPGWPHWQHPLNMHQSQWAIEYDRFLTDLLAVQGCIIIADFRNCGLSQRSALRFVEDPRDTEVFASEQILLSQESKTNRADDQVDAPYLSDQTNRVDEQVGVPIFPTHPTGDQSYLEGAEKALVSKRYERDPEARRRCIEHHGTACVVCGVDFSTAYPTIGNGFIHVHHKTPISQNAGRALRVNPVLDMVPICPNCHAMVHRRRPDPFTIEEIKEIYSRGNKVGGHK